MIDEMTKTIESFRPLMNELDWSDPEVYANWISQAYYIAKRSTSFLGLCLFHSEKYPAFQKRCAEHIGEETGHERLIENDLKKLNIKLKPELPSTMGVYQTQYFRIVAEDPLSFVGYIFFLELLAPAFGELVMNKISNKSAMSFLKVHASADEDHIEKAKQMLSLMSDETKKMAMTNFRMTAETYRIMLEQILSSSQQHLKSA